MRLLLRNYQQLSIGNLRNRFLASQGASRDNPSQVH